MSYVHHVSVPRQVSVGRARQLKLTIWEVRWKAALALTSKKENEALSL